MAQICRLLRDRTGCEPERAREVIANGMLLNTLLAMEAPEHAEEDPDLASSVSAPSVRTRMGRTIRECLAC